MDIKGLDYNTQRERLILPEYGREVQEMIDYAKTIQDRSERQRCVETIIGVMRRMSPKQQNEANYEQKLWDHLAIMSQFQLDIDYPYDITSATAIAQKPNPVPYPMQDIPVRHYGSMLFSVFEKLKTMEPSPARDELARQTANQMKRSLMQWSHGAVHDEKVLSDLAYYTDGKIQLDPSTFRFERINLKEQEKKRKKK